MASLPIKTSFITTDKVRRKRRKKYRSYSPTALTNAFKAVTQECMSVHKASKIFSVPETTLRDRISGRVRTLKSGPAPLLNVEEEGVLAAHFHALGSMGYHFSRAEVLEVASDYIISKGVRDKDNPLSHTWFYAFMTRWPELEMIRFQHLSNMRARALSDECTNFYFCELKNILEEYSVLDRPECIYFVEEHDINTDHVQAFASEGTPPVNPLLATMIGCGNGNGESIPPFFVLPGQGLSSGALNGCSEGVGASCSDDGQPTAEIFQTFLHDHFMKYMQRESHDQPVILLYNANRSYIPLSIIDNARDNNVILFALPSYISHILQLDGIHCLRQFDTILTEERQKFMKSNQTNITSGNVCEVACIAYKEAFTEENLKTSFNKAGIIPFNKNVIDSSRFIPIPENIQVKMEVLDDYEGMENGSNNEIYPMEMQMQSTAINYTTENEESQNDTDSSQIVQNSVSMFRKTINARDRYSNSAGSFREKRYSRGSRDSETNMSNNREMHIYQNGYDTVHKPRPKYVTAGMCNSLPKGDNTDNNVLLEPYDYICQIPGKQIRTKLAAAFDSWLNIPNDKLKIIGEATQMLHNASLLIDDIEDSSKLRRGIPVAHNIYGVAHTINSANYVYFLGLEKVLQLNHPDATKVFTEQLLELHRGQGMDIYWRDTVQCPTEDEYKQMVIRKTGGLFGLAVRLMQLFSENKSDFKPLLDTLGLYFQIRDDYANMVSKEYEANKSYCEDLTEGKFSFPTIHAIKFSSVSNQILSILRQRTTDTDVKKYCVECLEKAGSFDYTKQTLIDLEQRIFQLIEEHGGNLILSGLVNELRKLYREGK